MNRRKRMNGAHLLVGIWVLAFMFDTACRAYDTAKPWADAVCDVVHALPEASSARVAPGSSVVVTATSASIAAAVIAPAPAASSSAGSSSSVAAPIFQKKIEVGY
jgi:hypothetical protein